MATPSPLPAPVTSTKRPSSLPLTSLLRGRGEFGQRAELHAAYGPALFDRALLDDGKGVGPARSWDVEPELVEQPCDLELLFGRHDDAEASLAIAKRRVVRADLRLRCRQRAGLRVERPVHTFDRSITPLPPRSSAPCPARARCAPPSRRRQGCAARRCVRSRPRSRLPASGTRPWGPR